MHKQTFRTVLATVCVSLIPIVASAQTVAVDYDRQVDFSKFKSYAWVSGEPASNPLVHKRIVSGIEAQLASKGWTQNNETPNALVVYYAAIDAERQLNAWGNGPRWNGFGSAKIETILTGQLVVDVYDARNEELIWRGVVSDEVSDKPEKNEKRLNEAIAKLFKQFPPARSNRTN